MKNDCGGEAGRTDGGGVSEEDPLPFLLKLGTKKGEMEGLTIIIMQER